MKKFRRKAGAVATQLSAYEVELLSSLVSQLVEMVSDGDPDGFAEPEADDPFEEWSQDLASDPDQPEAARGPGPATAVPGRLPARRGGLVGLPPVHRTGSEGQEDHRGAPGAGPAAGDRPRRRHELRIPVSEVDVWLRTLTSVRLAVAHPAGHHRRRIRRGAGELPDDDPRAFMVSVYDWLGFAQETLISAL